jgi:hypothetical protein
MRRSWVALVALGLACLPAGALADDPPAPAASPATYVVKAGDTLWSIAHQVWKDGGLWRALLEPNPFITDPNRIYPGDTLALPGAQSPPPAAGTPAPAGDVQAEADPATAPTAEAAAAAVEAQAAPPVAPPRAMLTTEAPAPLPPASPHALACTPVLLPEGQAGGVGMGTLVKSDDDRLMLSAEDDVFVGLQEGRRATVGERLAVVRLGDRVPHPRSGRSMGRVLETLGVLEVREVRDRTLKARVVYGCMPMGVGDRVTPFSARSLPATPAAVPAARPVEGTVVGARHALQLVALQHLVFLDVGSGQGIREGDVFAIYRPSLAAVGPAGAEFPIPPERLGEAVVLRATEGTATAVLTTSKKESRPGDRVVLSRQAGG